MHDNHLYNLMNQLTIEHKSLWRIKKYYGDDSGDCSQCSEFWQKMIKDKEDHIKELTQLIHGHMDA